MNENPKILIVDDQPENLLALELSFEDEPCEIVKALSGNEALSLMLVHDFAVVLLDVQMPGMDGFETAQLMRGNRKTKHLPIIFVTAISKEKQHIFKGYKAGAVDYIFKPLDPEILISKVNIFLNLYNQKKQVKKINTSLTQANIELEKANMKILKQQKKILEEERLKVLLNMAGATAHELNQPLTTLLGNIELIEMCRDEPEEITELLYEIKKAGLRISRVVKKIQTIRHYEVKPYLQTKSIIDIDQAVNILCIEDSNDDFIRIKDTLTSIKDISLLHARSVKEGLTFIGDQTHSRIDLIFLDFVLEDGNGFDFLNQIAKKGLEIPVVIITGQGDDVVSAQLIQAGACDYLPKSKVSAKSLSRIITNALEKSRLKKDLARMQARLVETSTKDELTGLYNRRYILEVLKKERERVNRYSGDLALLMIDIDHFKKVNDTHGHPTGDLVLSRIAIIFSYCVRQNDIVGRFGGEEFIIILPHASIEDALLAGEKIRQAVEKEQFSDMPPDLKITVSIGVSAYNSTNKNNSSTDTLLKNVDNALYLAKKNGRNQVRT